MSFHVLGGILQDDAQDQEQVYPIVFISLHLVDEKDIRWQNDSKKDHPTSTWGRASPCI
jgi:hypothetical protein